MDLRKYLAGAEIERGAGVLNYQPFILSDDVQTGVAYSWVVPVADPWLTPPLVFRKSELSQADWDLAVDANARQRAMYEDLLDAVAARYPGGTLLDSACSNGYFPVGAELRGMHGTGMDPQNNGPAITFLNETLGTSAKYVPEAYNFRTHRFPDVGSFDVTVASAIMCHLPDPLDFLAALGRITKHAILFWGQVIDTEHLLVAYNEPRFIPGDENEFPHAFNDNTRISMGLLKHAVRQMGFREIIQIPHSPTWLYQILVPAGRSLERELGESWSPQPALLIVR